MNATPTSLSADFWTPASFAELTGGVWLNPSGDPGATLSGLSIDSRSLETGQAFVAITGERFDGHDFIAEVEAKGAALAIVERERSPLINSASGGGMAILRVPSTLTALQTLASRWRERLGNAGCRIISVSGSNGKTTTRHLIHQVLTHGGYIGTQSPKSFNNQIGVPLTLLAGRAGTRQPQAPSLDALMWTRLRLPGPGARRAQPQCAES